MAARQGPAFAVPSGIPGRLGGLFMLWTNRQDEVLQVLDVRPGDRVLEVGYGPGGLVRLLVARTEAGHVDGVDPSPAMRSAALRRNRDAVRAGRVDLRLGSAARTGLPDHSVDLVVAVNNVCLWPDLDAGLRELHRVLRPGGAVVLSWQGGTAPDLLGRRLRLPERRWDTIERVLSRHFVAVRRYRLRRTEVVRADRMP